MPRRRIVLGWVLIPLLLMPSCATTPSVKEAGLTIAVWDLDDFSPATGPRTDLGELLSARVMEGLRKNEKVSLVERERLLRVLEELHLGTTAVVDEATRLKLGRLAGARWMVFGGYQIIGDQMRLDLRVVEVETGKVRKAVQKTTMGTGIAVWTEAAGKVAEELL
jgi:hypothetical protein